MLMISGALWVAVAAHGAMAADPPGGMTTASHTVSPLERRVALLARELDLDEAQKLKVRALLQHQREQIVQAWQDESLSGAVRVARTQAISEKTEDGIRALLTDAQRQKYLKPRTDRATMGRSSDDLANYVDKMNRR